jgi:hypothetical protein
MKLSLSLAQQGNLYPSVYNCLRRPDRNMLYAGGAIKLANIEGPNGLIWKSILAHACKVRYA